MCAPPAVEPAAVDNRDLDPPANDSSGNPAPPTAFASDKRDDGVPTLREGTPDEVLRGDAGWCVVHGDALHVLRDLPDGCVHAFVTDPPYSSGGAFRGDRVKPTTAKYVSTNSANKEIPAFEGDVRDQRFVAFSDWRQLPWLIDAKDLELPAVVHALRGGRKRRGRPCRNSRDDRTLVIPGT